MKEPLEALEPVVAVLADVGAQGGGGVTSGASCLRCGSSMRPLNSKPGVGLCDSTGRRTCRRGRGLIFRRAPRSLSTGRRWRCGRRSSGCSAATTSKTCCARPTMARSPSSWRGKWPGCRPATSSRTTWASDRGVAVPPRAAVATAANVPARQGPELRPPLRPGVSGHSRD